MARARHIRSRRLRSRTWWVDTVPPECTPKCPDTKLDLRASPPTRRAVRPASPQVRRCSRLAPHPQSKPRPTPRARPQTRAEAVWTLCELLLGGRGAPEKIHLRPRAPTSLARASHARSGLNTPTCPFTWSAARRRLLPQTRSASSLVEPKEKQVALERDDGRVVPALTDGAPGDAPRAALRDPRGPEQEQHGLVGAAQKQHARAAAAPVARALAACHQNFKPPGSFRPSAALNASVPSFTDSAERTAGTATSAGTARGQAAARSRASSASWHH